MNQHSLSTVVVDDDKFQLQIISDFVGKTNFLNLVGAYSDPIVALDSIGIEKPDILLLDVEMPNLTGFELLRSLQNPPATVVITGSDQYAVEAFDLNIIDYLVKPVDDYSRFLKALNKVRLTIGETRQDSTGDSIFVRENSLLSRVQYDYILYVEAYGDYVKLTTEKKKYVVHTTLSNILKRLPNHFMKVHRSYVVNLKKIKNLDQSNLQIGEKIIPISKSLRPKLLERLEIV